MSELQAENSRLICGIVASNKVKGVASVAIRALAIASEILTDTNQQREALQVLGKVAKNTGWNVHALLSDLPRKWGWPNGSANQRSASGTLVPPSNEQMLRLDHVSGALPPEIVAATTVMHQQLPKNCPQHRSSPGMRQQQQGGTPP